MIENAEQVTSYFGYWPEFCDAKVVSFSYNKSGIIELCVFYIDAELSKSAHVTLRFIGVAAITLNDLLSENVIDEISIEGDGPFVISIEPCYGLGGQFECKLIQVTNFSV